MLLIYNHTKLQGFVYGDEDDDDDDVGGVVVIVRPPVAVAVWLSSLFSLYADSTCLEAVGHWSS